MAQEQVQGILEGLKIAQQRRAENARNSIEQQRLLQESDQRSKELDFQRNELGERKRQFDITTKAAQAMHNLQVLQEEQRISGNLQGGMSIPGAVSSPGADDQHLSYQVPGLDNPISVLTPEALRAKQQADETAKLTPEHENRMIEINTQATNAQRLASQQREDQLAQAKVVQDYENQRAATHEAGENFRTSATNAAHIQAAKIGQGLEGLTPEMITPYVQQGVQGDLTEEQLNKLPLPKGVKSAIVQGVTGAGGALLNNDEQKVTQSFTPISQIVGKLDQYNAILKQNPAMSRIPGTDAYKQTKLIGQEIEGLLPNVARVIATDTGRLSNTQIQMVKGMAEPSKNFLTNDPAINEQRRNDFLGLSNAIVDSKLSRLPAAQRSAVKQKLGLTKIPMLGGQQQQQQGPTHLFYDAQGNQVQGAQQ